MQKLNSIVLEFDTRLRYAPITFITAPLSSVWKSGASADTSHLNKPDKSFWTWRKVTSFAPLSASCKLFIYYIWVRERWFCMVVVGTYVDVKVRDRECLRWWRLLRHESIEFDSVPIPLDGVKRHVLQVVLACQRYRIVYLYIFGHFDDEWFQTFNF